MKISVVRDCVSASPPRRDNGSGRYRHLITKRTAVVPRDLCPWAFHTGQNTGFDLVQLKAKSPRLPGIAKGVSAASPAPLSPGGH